MQYEDGVLIANITPFKGDLLIDWEALRYLIRRLKGIDGVRGFVVNAYAGEGPTLTIEERTQAIALHREEANADQPVVAAILDASTDGAIRQANEAKAAGADSLLICPPEVSAWNAAASPHIAMGYHSAIAERVDLPMILFQLYGNPASYSHELLIRMAKEIDRVFAVKMAQASDAVRYDRDYIALKKLPKRILTLPAVGSSLFHALNTGADGILTGLATFAPYEMTEMWKTSKRGDFSTLRNLHLRLAPMTHMIYGYPYVDLHTRYKELAQMAGAIPSAAVRGPQVSLASEERDALRSTLDIAELTPLPEV